MSSDKYRNEVQTRIQDLISGNRPRDPHLSALSTRRLVIEGVVEEIRIYRLRKQEKAREEKAMSKDRSRERVRREEKGEEGRGHQHRHRERSGERHHDRERSGGRRRRHRSGSRRRHGEEHQHRDGSRRRDGLRRDRDVADPVTEVSPDNDQEYTMTGGAGPASALPPATNQARQCPPERGSPQPIKAGILKHPPTQHGPDGSTPFGQLPRKAAGVGLTAHFMNTYRHIKAEHDAGHRQRSVVEKKVDGWRGKGTSSSTGGEKLRKEETRREGSRERRAGRRDDGDRKNKGHRRRGERRDHDERGNGEFANMYVHAPREYLSELALDRPPRARGGQGPTPSPTIPRENVSPHPPSTSMQASATPVPARNTEPAWPPTPETFKPPPPTAPAPAPPPSGTTPYPTASRQRGNPPIIPMPQNMPLPPPPPPMPASRRQPSPRPPISTPPPPPPPLTRPAAVPTPTPAPRDLLLSEITSAPKLRRVPPSAIKDKSMAFSAGRVYEATPHSQEVEARERAEEEEENESGRMRRLRDNLGEFDTETEDEDEDEELMGRDRKAVGHRNRDGNVGTPSWEWGNLTKGKRGRRDVGDKARYEI